MPGKAIFSKWYLKAVIEVIFLKFKRCFGNLLAFNDFPRSRNSSTQIPSALTSCSKIKCHFPREVYREQFILRRSNRETGRVPNLRFLLPSLAPLHPLEDAHNTPPPTSPRRHFRESSSHLEPWTSHTYTSWKPASLTVGVRWLGHAQFHVSGTKMRWTTKGSFRH